MGWAEVRARYTQGTCQVCGVPARMFFCDDHKDPKARPPKDEWAIAPKDVPAKATTPRVEKAPPGAEPPPASDSPTLPTGKRGVFGRLFGKNKANRPRPQPAASRPRRRPKLGASGPRRAAYTTLGEGWESLGQFLSGSPLMAAGRVMTFQGESAGYILDDVVKGTVIDKVAVQPIVNAEERYGAAMRLISLPIQMQLVASKVVKLQALASSGNAEAFAAQQFQLNWQIRSAKKTIRKSLPELAKAAARHHADEAKAAEAVHEAWPELEGMRDENGNPIDPVDLLFNEIMGPLIAPEGNNNGYQESGTASPNGREPDGVDVREGRS